jgi:NAD(P)-dependent dehydrogenase (short-subunit alcohol dehydrogenase family)
MPTLLITGASRGLGLEFTRHYAMAGWQAIATCRNPERADALRAFADRAGGRVEIVALDVTDPEASRRLAAGIGGRPIDVLIANAGIAGPRDAAPTDIDEAAWAEVMRVNVMAPLRLAGLLTDAVAASERKLMAFISSRLGSMAANQTGGGYIYRSSKAALNAVVKSLAIDLAKRGITAVALHPGWVKTDMGGPGADIDAATSVAGMAHVLERITLGDSGRLITYSGEPLPW